MEPKGSTNLENGLHVVVINPSSGEVEAAKVLDADTSKEAFDDYIMNEMTDEKIVVAASNEHCATTLSQEVRTWFEDMGS